MLACRLSIRHADNVENTDIIPSCGSHNPYIESPFFCMYIALLIIKRVGGIVYFC